MKKKEIIDFLKEEHKRIEDILYQLGEIKEPTVDQETLNYHIQARFRDALMYMRTGRTGQLEDLLDKASKEKWI